MVNNEDSEVEVPDNGDSAFNVTENEDNAFNLSDNQDKDDKFNMAFIEEEMINNESDLMNTCCSTSFSSKSNSSYDLLSTSSAFKLAENKEDLIEYLKEIGLLASEMNCSKCNTKMHFTVKKSSSDGYRFVCRQCKRELSIRTGSIFSGSKLKIKEIFLIIYLLCKGDPAYSTIKHCPEINPKAIYKWYSTLREIVKQAHELHPPCFKQNVSASIQIDETLIGKKRKYNKGKYFKQEWLFGMAQQEEHLCYITRVEKRDKKTLIPIITCHADPSSKLKIISDGWLAYKDLQRLGYDHSVVIHKEEFVNKQGDHTNSIESLWSQLKSWFSGMHGVKACNVDSYIEEFMYRYNLAKSSRGNCYTHFIKDVKEMYKV